MVAVLDAYAQQQAQNLVRDFGDLALPLVRARAQEAMTHGDAILVAVWQVVAFDILFIQAVKHCELTDNNRAEIREIG